LSLTLCWCLLLGPATERATYALFGPVLAHGLLQSWRNGTARDRWWWAAALFLTLLDAIPVPRLQQAEHPWLRIPLPLATLVAAIALAMRAHRDLRGLTGQPRHPGLGSDQWPMACH